MRIAIVGQQDFGKAVLEAFLADWPIGRPIEVVPNVVPAIFEETPAPLSPRSDRPFTFLAVANHLPIKALDVLLHAFAQLANGTCRLRVVGDGPQRSDLERLARELGVAGRIDFLGMRDPAKVRLDMQGAHALVVSSRYETFGVVAIEAMCCGLPVVATRCGGPQDVMTEETGIMAEPGDVGSLAEAMTRMIAEHERFDANAIRRSVLSRFGKATFSERLAQVYDAVLARARAG